MSAPRQERPFARAHLRLAAATIALAGLGGGAIAVLAQGEFAAPPPQPRPSAPALAEAPSASANAGQAPKALAPEAPEPPGRSLEGSPELPPLAQGWRKAVVLSQRDRVMAGARALRQAPDGKEQLLALMEDANPRVRAFALRELGRRRDKSLEPQLKRFLSDPDPHVVENARWALNTLERVK
jgi:HEAT repeat protein